MFMPAPRFRGTGEWRWFVGREAGKAPGIAFYNATHYSGLMQRRSFADMHCSLAQCLEVVGEWWSLLIVRDAFLGVTRFDEFQERLGISRNILDQRLSRLVDSGVLAKIPYSEHPPSIRLPPD
jgi:hypothetical protein